MLGWNWIGSGILHFRRLRDILHFRRLRDILHFRRLLDIVATSTAATASSNYSTHDGGEKRTGIRFSDQIRLPFGSFRADALSVFSCRFSVGLFVPMLCRSFSADSLSVFSCRYSDGLFLPYL